MALTDLPTGVTVVGSLEVVLYMSEEGLGVAHGYEGMGKEAAIGYLTVVSDRLREEVRLQWDRCPGCGERWDDHFDQEDDGEEGDQDDGD